MNDVDLIPQGLAAAPERSVPSTLEELWETVRAEARTIAAREELLRPFLTLAVLRHESFGAALATLLARKLADSAMSAEKLEALVREAFAEDPAVLDAAVSDLVATRTRDPAAETYVTPFLYYKGFHALEWHRVNHYLWRRRRRAMADFVQSRVSEFFAADIHPAVPVGRGVFIDHGTGIVIGETSVIGDDVSILQEVTLGGTGKDRGDRHPKVRDGVLLAAGAKVLGNIEIGRGAKVGAGSVVLKDVPPCATVAGVPAKIVGWCSEAAAPALAMDQSLPAGEGI
jgi:serine O-acetyltransferase